MTYYHTYDREDLKYEGPCVDMVIASYMAAPMTKATEEGLQQFYSHQPNIYAREMMP